jgi:hypothetical protein
VNALLRKSAAGHKSVPFPNPDEIRYPLWLQKNHSLSGWSKDGTNVSVLKKPKNSVIP